MIESRKNVSRVNEMVKSSKLFRFRWSHKPDSLWRISPFFLSLFLQDLGKMCRSFKNSACSTIYKPTFLHHYLPLTSLPVRSLVTLGQGSNWWNLWASVSPADELTDICRKLPPPHVRCRLASKKVTKGGSERKPNNGLILAIQWQPADRLIAFASITKKGSATD